jgi:hypothetical protein
MQCKGGHWAACLWLIDLDLLLRLGMVSGSGKRKVSGIDWNIRRIQLFWEKSMTHMFGSRYAWASTFRCALHCDDLYKAVG